MEELDLDLDFGGVDFGGVDVNDIDLGDFNIGEGFWEEETRYVKPSLYALKKNYIMYDNAKQLAKKLRIGENDRYDVVVNGSFIFGDFIEAFVVENNAKCKKMTISTLSLSQENIDSLENLLLWNYVDELNVIISAYFYSHYRGSLVRYMYEHLDKDNKFQLAVAGVHTKTCQFETLGGKKIVMHGSANLRSSGNIEQFTIEENEELYDFYDNAMGNILDRYATINKQIRGQELWRVITNDKNK